jgi:DNA-binding beta-propeller fold protein YncE
MKPVGRLLVVGGLLAVIAASGCGDSGSTAPTRSEPAPGARVAPLHGATHEVLAVHRAGRLPAPVQLPAVAALPGGAATVMGGLDAADASLDTIIDVAPRQHATQVGTLPSARHDAAAASLGGKVFFFGGGNAGTTSDAVLDIRRGNATKQVANLPVGASDVEATAVGGVAYVFGGYTGAAPLRSIVAYRPGQPPRTVATLPLPLRYAAVARVGSSVLIAGGTSGSTATDAVLRFDPATGRVRRIGRLPTPVTHAAGVALGGRFYVVGGRGDDPSSQRRSILSVDPGTGRVRHAGRLPVALSDLGAASYPDHAIVLGGRDGNANAHDQIYRLTLGPRPVRTSPRNVYAAAGAGMLSSVVRNDPARVYVPNSQSNTVDVISQRTGKVIRHFDVGALPQHVTPSWDMKTLWVTNDQGNSLTPIDPRTSRPGKPVPVTDPYNLYFTVDGRYAIVVAEAHQRLDFRDAHTMRLHHSLNLPQCKGVDHMDFSADGRLALASCEFAGRVVVIDIAHERVRKVISLRAGAMPQDVKLSPDGRTFYVADMASNGVWLIDAHRLRRERLIRTGNGAHGLYPSRDAKELYVSNRGEGSISVISFRTRRVLTKWRLPGGGSPDMGGVSADGRALWLSGRYNAEVYEISTRNGRLLRRIDVGSGPHGLCVWPQPGRYSIGHTGITR